jgi:hypothetical protein
MLSEGRVPISTVKQLCEASSAVTSDNLVDQVALLERLDEIAKNGRDAREFFRRNHFTDGLKRLVEQGLLAWQDRASRAHFT